MKTYNSLNLLSFFSPALLLGALMLSPQMVQAANAPTSKATVCHLNVYGQWQLNEVGSGSNAFSAHMAHGDGVPLGAVPNSPGFTFSAQCVPVLSLCAEPAPNGQTVIASITADILRGKSINEFGDLVEDRSIESPIGNLVADGIAWAARSQIAFANPGSLRADLLYLGFEWDPSTDGQVTYEEAERVQPFGISILTFPMTGAQIVDVLKQQCQPFGVSRPFLNLAVSSAVTYDRTKSSPTGFCTLEVSNVKVNGVALDPAATYTVSTNSFLASGGDNFTAFRAIDPSLQKVAACNDTRTFTSYVSVFSPLSPPAIGRATDL